MAKENKRVVLGDGFQPAELLALSKAVPASVAGEQREELETGVYQVNVVARVTGDIEIGIPEKMPVKFDSAKYLVAALGALPKEQRKKILARPVVKKEVKAVIEMELAGLKAKLPKQDSPAKLTPHLAVSFESRGP